MGISMKGKGLSDVQSRRRYLLLSLLLAIASFSSMPLVAAPVAWQPLEDPMLRAAQFDLSQGTPFESLTQLKAEQSQGRIKGQSAQLQLTLGEMYLAYGSHHKAATIFTALGESDQSQPLRDLAWLQLAKLQYQRQQLDKALKTLKRIVTDLSGQAQQEQLLLNAMLLMQGQRFAKAETQLRRLGQRALVRQLGEKSLWPTYGRFNLGVALFQQGNVEEGCQLLAELGTAGADTEENRALRDKANLTLAYHYLSEKDPEQAQAYFVKTRLQGPMSNKALLGLGRAYSAKQQHKKSLVPWLRLIKQNASDPAVQDGLLAVPFAFGKLDAYKQALQYYQQALAAFKNEMEQVRLVEEAVNNGAMLDTLTAVKDGQGVVDREAVSTLPGSGYLWQLLATHEFQETLKNYAQLRLSLMRLKQWSADINKNQNLTRQQRQKRMVKIASLQSRAADMTERLQTHLKMLVTQELSARKECLLGYASEARFSMAQIYDYAAKRWEGGS